MEWSLLLYGTAGDNPNEDIVRAHKPVRAVDKEANRACTLPSENLNSVMHEEKQVRERRRDRDRRLNNK